MSQALEAAVLAYADALVHHREGEARTDDDADGAQVAEVLQLAEAVIAARTRLFRALRAAGWTPPPDVLASLIVDETLLAEADDRSSLPAAPPAPLPLSDPTPAADDPAPAVSSSPTPAAKPRRVAR